MTPAEKLQQKMEANYKTIRRDRFFPEHPPVSGNAKQLWDWWMDKTSIPIRYLHINRPGKWQRARGIAHYVIATKEQYYCVWDVAHVVNLCNLDDALFLPIEDVWILG